MHGFLASGGGWLGSFWAGTTGAIIASPHAGESVCEMEFAMNCPVCNDPATEDITSRTFYGKTFRCPNCGEYDIVGSVYEYGALKALEPAKRKDALGVPA